MGGKPTVWFLLLLSEMLPRVPCPGGSCATALDFICHLGERRKPVFSINAAGTEGGFWVSKWEETISKHHLVSGATRLSLFWRWQPRSILASGVRQGSCSEDLRLVPPSCSLLWHPCPLAKQSPINKWNVIISNKQALQSAKSGWNHKEILVSYDSFEPCLRAFR